MFVKKYAIYELAAAERHDGGDFMKVPLVVLHRGLGGVHNSPEEAVKYLKENFKILGGPVKKFVILETWQYDECAKELGLSGIPWDNLNTEEMQNVQLLQAKA